MVGLERRDLEAYEFVLAHIERMGYQPTPGEIALGLGLTASAVRYRLKKLERAGVISSAGGLRTRSTVLRHVRFLAYFTEQPDP